MLFTSNLRKVIDRHNAPSSSAVSKIADHTSRSIEKREQFIRRHTCATIAVQNSPQYRLRHMHAVRSRSTMKKIDEDEVCFALISIFHCFIICLFQLFSHKCGRLRKSSPKDGEAKKNSEIVLHKFHDPPPKAI